MEAYMAFEEWRTNRQIHEGRKPIVAANGIIESLFITPDGSAMQRSSDGTTRHMLMYDGITDTDHSAVGSEKGIVTTRSPDGTRHRWLMHGIISVDNGRDFYAALSTKGVMYTWGNGVAGQLGRDDGDYTNPRPVHALKGRRVVSMSAGSTHCIAVTDHGEAFVWGSISGLIHIPSPTRVHALAGIRVRGASAGLSHILIVTEDGALYSFGENQHGQLGHSGSSDRATPTIVGALRHMRIASAAAGAQHSLAMTEGGSVLTWGGHNHTSGITTPAFVLGALEQVKVCYISAGDGASAAISVSGELFTWWSGNESGHRTTMESPSRIGISGEFTEKVSIGSQETLAVTANGSVFCWNTHTNLHHTADHIQSPRLIKDIRCSPADGRTTRQRLTDPVTQKNTDMLEQIALLQAIAPERAIVHLVALLRGNNRMMINEHALRELRDITTRYPELTWAIANADVIETLVALMNDRDGDGHNRDAKAAAMLLQTLTMHTTISSETARAFVQAHTTIAPLVALLRAGSDTDSEHVNRAAALALSVIATDADNRFRIANTDAITHLVGLLNHHSDTVAAAAAHTLRMMFAYISDTGAIPALVELLRRPGTQAAACWALANLAMIATNRIAIEEAGAIVPIIAILQSHGEAAASALRNLAVRTENNAAIALAGAVRPLVSLLESHHGNGTNAAAAGALSNLAKDNDAQQEIAEAGAIPKLVPLLRVRDVRDGSHLTRDEVTVITTVTSALMNICQASETRKQVVDMGGIAHLVELLSTGVDDLTVAAARVLSNLSIDTENRMKIADSGAIPYLLQMYTRGDDAKAAAKTMLQRLLMDTTVKNAFIQRYGL